VLGFAIRSAAWLALCWGPSSFAVLRVGDMDRWTGSTSARGSSVEPGCYVSLDAMEKSQPMDRSTMDQGPPHQRVPVPFDAAGVAFLIEAALSAQRCQSLREQASALGFCATADDYPPSYRNNDRYVYDDAELASALFAELGPLLPAQMTDAEGNTWTLRGLNSRFRFCRYRDGQGFRIHQDGAHEPGPDRRSILTMQVYLDDDPARVGGQTRFYSGRSGGLLGGVTPRIGRAIVFEHRLWHDGEPVRQGEKHVLRTDVMYQRPRAAAAIEPAARDPNGHEPAHILRGHRGYVFALAALPQGELASGSRDGTLRIFQRSSGVQRACFAGHRGSISSLCPLSDGASTSTMRLLSGGRDHAVFLHDLQRGASTPLAELPAAVLSFADCRPAFVAAGCADGGIYLFDRQSLLARDGLPEQRGQGPSLAPASALPRRGGWVWALLPRPRGRLLSAGEDGCLRLWDLASRSLLAECALGHGAVHALAACAGTDQPAEQRSSGIVAGCSDGHLVWLTEGEGDFLLRPQATCAVHRGEIYAVCTTQSGGILSAGEDGRIAQTRLVDASLQPAQPPQLGSHSNFVRSLAVLTDDSVASAGYDGSIAIWDLRAT